MAEPLPAGVAEHLPSAITSVEARLQPVRADVLAGLMVRLWDCGIQKPEPETLKHWRRLLEVYPADLIGKAFDEVAKAHVWPRPPAVADVIKHIKPELERLNGWRRKLMTAKLRADMDAKAAASRKPTGKAYSDMDPAEREAFDRRMEALKSSLGTKPIPGTTTSPDGRTGTREPAAEPSAMTDREFTAARQRLMREAVQVAGG